MTKKLFIVFIIVFVLIFLGIVAYYFFQQSNNPQIVPRVPDFFGSLGGGQDNDPPLQVGVPPEEDTVVGNFESSVELQRLRQVAIEPVAGAVLFERDNENIIRYIERETGHIYEVKAGETEKTRISNTTIPRIQHAVFSGDGNHVAVQYHTESIDETETFVAKINVASTTPDEETATGSVQTLDIVFLPVNSHNLAFINDIFNYTTTLSSGTQGFELDLDSREATRIFSIPLREVLVQWTDRGPFVQNKSSVHTFGYVYEIENGELGNKVINSFPGLTAIVNPEGTRVVFGQGEENFANLFEHTVGTTEFSQLIVNVLADKCAWSTATSSSIYCGGPLTLPDGLYPDDWYMGLVSTNDNIWKINIDEINSQILISLEEASGRAIDAVNIQAGPRDEQLIFMNKSDSTLWELNLEGV